MKTSIIYEDNFLLICRKPAGLATQTAKVGQQDMVSELKNYLAKKQETGKAPYLGIIHRLDQPVEGLLVFAKDKKTAAALTASLEKGTLHKQYYAVVCGNPQKKTGELVDYLLSDMASGNVVMDAQADKGKKAVLQYRVITQLSAPQPHALLDIHIHTGRFHQIRIQMAHAGLPLLGDCRYGSAKSMQLSRMLGVPNVALCAYRIALIHPVTKRNMEFQIEPEGNIFRNILS